jgi:hypothetical protein
VSTIHFKSLDELFELIDSKIVVTEQGPYIRVDDLKELNEALGQARAEQKKKDSEPKPKGFAGAKEAALKDPEFMKLFEPKSPQAPAVGRDKNVPVEETHNEPAAA